MGSDPKKLFPYELLMEHLRKFGKFGLIMATMLLPIITAESGIGIDLDDLANQIEGNSESMTDNFLSMPSQAEFGERLRGVCVDMLRLEYI